MTETTYEYPVLVSMLWSDHDISVWKIHKGEFEQLFYKDLDEHIFE